MACSGEYEVRVDRRGRLVLPAEVRRLLGLENGGRLVLRVRGGWVELAPPGAGDPEKRAALWREQALAERLEPFTEEAGERVEEEWEWMGREYAERKLGIR